MVLIVSVYAFYMIFFRKTTRSELAREEIEALKVGGIFGKPTYRFILKNGKARNLLTGKSEADQQIVLDMAERLGIPRR